MIVGSEISKELRMMGHGEHNQSGIKTKYKHWTVIMIMMTMIDDDNGRWWWLFNHKNHFPGLVLDLALMMKRTQRRRFFLHISPSFILISTILTSSLLLFLKSKPGEWLPGSRNRRSQHRPVEDRALQKVLPHVQGQRNWGDCLYDQEDGEPQKHQICSRARPVPVKLFLRLSKMSMMRSGVITDQGWDHHYQKDIVDGTWLAVW